MSNVSLNPFILKALLINKTLKKIIQKHILTFQNLYQTNPKAISDDDAKYWIVQTLNIKISFDKKIFEKERSKLIIFCDFEYLIMP